MPLHKPYYRIYRPSSFKDVFTGDLTFGYDRDERYIDPKEKSSLLSAAKLILKDYEELLEYVEPCDKNKDTYSHRIYELLLRTCTEVEANLEGIMKANGYKKPDKKNLTMTDYRKVESATKLSGYSVTMHQWRPDRTVHPFDAWKTQTESLRWYTAYNKVKHDRSKNFDKANLENLSNAICGLLCVLSAQFGHSLDNVDSQPSSLVYCDTENAIEIVNYSVNLPDFQESEEYGFNWEELKDTPEPYTQYRF